jgi:GNAT superfamily N-acetyltransferase
MTAAPAVFELAHDGFVVSTERARLDLDAIYRYLSEESYWAAGIARDVLERSVANALPFGLYAPGGVQIGFARVVSDFARFAWLSDVYVLAAHRGKGLGHFLVAGVMAHPQLQGLRRWMLSTNDAHRIYAEYGFGDVDPETLMTRPDRAAERRGS